jgi:hypothetical protein
MMRLITRILFALLLAVPLPLHAQETPEEFVVFIHSGPRNPDDPLVVQIASSLAERGFIVRVPDNLRSPYDDPRVDYFSQSAYRVARLVADLVNTAKSGALSPNENKPLTPQLLSTKNRATYLAVRLF